MGESMMTYKSVNLSDHVLEMFIESDKKWHVEQAKEYKNKFLSYLYSYEVKEEILEAAKSFDWVKTLCLINIKTDLLWDSFEIPKHLDEVKDLRINFKEIIMLSIEVRLFHIVYKTIYQYLYTEKSKDTLNDYVYQGMKVGANVLFHSYDMQYSLTSLNYNDDPQIFIPELDRLHRDAEQGRNFPKGKQRRQDEILKFINIMNIYNNQTSKLYGENFQTIAFRIGAELGYKHIFDINKKTGKKYKRTQLERFYDRFLDWKKGELKKI